MSLLTNLPHTCKRLRRTRTVDTLGGAYDSYTQVGDDLDCWRQPATASDINLFAKRGITVTDKVYFIANPALDEQWLLEIGSSWYIVKAVSDPDASAGLSVVWKVMIELTTVGSTPYRTTQNPDGTVD